MNSSSSLNGSVMSGIVGGQKLTTFGAVPPNFSSSCDRCTIWSSSGGLGSELKDYLLTECSSMKDWRTRTIAIMNQDAFTTKAFLFSSA